MADPNGEIRTFRVDPKHLKVSAPRIATQRNRVRGGAVSLAETTRTSEVIQTAGNPVASSPDALTVRTVPAPVAPAAAPVPAQTGGSSAVQTKVILGGKKRHSRVLLSHKRHKQPIATAAAIPVSGQIKGKPIKTRKITIKLQGLKRRMTKARKTARMSKTLPLDHIRKELIKRKLIKVNSKAPEGMLREMYSDAQLVANKSL